MSHRGVRVALFLIAAALLIGTGYRIYLFEGRVASSAEQTRQFDLDAQETSRQLGDLRAAQAGYVAAGQGRDFWPAKVTALLREVGAGFAALTEHAPDEMARGAVADAKKSIDQFVKLDARAREYVSASQLLMASDVIFADGIELVTAAIGHLDRARDHLRQEHDRFAADTRRLEMYTLLATGALMLLLMMPLVTVTRVEVDAPASEVTRTARPPDLTLRTAPTPPAVRLPPSGPEVSLKEAAALSLDFARVASPSELNDLLGRACKLLHARGIVLWIPTGGGELRPGMAHGYSEAMLAKVASIPVNGENATATAYRLGEVREVPAGNSPTGAVIAPLLTSAGCAGVLAVELPAGAESHTAVQAIVTFIAAQLASIVGVSTPSETRASASDVRSARASS